MKARLIAKIGENKREVESKELIFQNCLALYWRLLAFEIAKQLGMGKEILKEYFGVESDDDFDIIVSSLVPG